MIFSQPSGDEIDRTCTYTKTILSPERRKTSLSHKMEKSRNQIQHRFFGIGIFVHFLNKSIFQNSFIRMITYNGYNIQSKNKNVQNVLRIIKWKCVRFVLCQHEIRSIVLSKIHNVIIISQIKTFQKQDTSLYNLSFQFMSYWSLFTLTACF